MLNLDMWEIPQLPYMQNLKHLTVALSVSTTLRLYVDLPGASLRAEDLRPEASDC